MNGTTARRLLADNAGAAAILLAISMPVVVGGFGLGTEIGLWYFNQRKLQNAADVAAYAAATELRAGRALGRIQAAADEAARGTGYDAARGTIVVTTPHGGDPDRVEVRLEEDVPRMFSGLFTRGDVTMGGRAVAELTEGVPTCVLALDPSASGAVTFTGTTEMEIKGCNVHSNSLHDDSVVVVGNPRVRTDCVSSSGGIDLGREQLLTLTECSAPYERARVVEDPYEHLTPPTDVMAEPCKPHTEFGQNGAPHSLTPGRYCGTLTIKREATLAPGVYVVEGDVHITSTAKVVGDGITLYIKGNGKFHGNGQADIKLRAPTGGRYANVLLHADAPNTTTSPARHVLNGTSNSYFDGVVYAPRGDLDILGNNGSSNACMQVVARTITFTGNSSLGIDCEDRFADLRAVRQIRLVE